MTIETKPAIELRNIKHAEFASEETNCYSATLYVDGVRWGEVGNDGHGGCDHFHGDIGKGYGDLDTLNARIAATFPPVELGEGFDPSKADIESVCGDILTEWLIARDLKKALKRVYMFTKPGTENAGKVFEVPLKQKGRTFLPENVDRIMTAKYPGLVSLNMLPFDQALAIFRKAA